MAKTEFSKEEDLNLIYQEYIKGKSDFLISFDESNKELLEYLQFFSSNAMKMIEEIEWIPDLDFGKTEKGFLLRNIIIEKSTFLPKIIDNTYYLDQNRMYPQLKIDSLKGMMGRILQLNEWLNNKL